jgi:hypothetical protein
MLFFVLSFTQTVLETHWRCQRHRRRLRILEVYSAQAVDICLQEHSVEEQLRLSSLLEQLNSEDLLLHALSFLRAFLGTVQYRLHLCLFWDSLPKLSRLLLLSTLQRCWK